MKNKLNGLKVAILATDGFEQSELLKPKQALKEAGAEVSIVSLKTGEIKGWNENNWGETVAVDLTLENAKAEDFDALQLPGGVINPDKLRMEKSAVDFIKSFANAGKPIAAICHAPWTLIEAKIVSGVKVTSWSSLRTDLENAGAIWEDKEVVVSNGIITSRNPQDIPAFNERMIEEFAKSDSANAKSATQ